MKIAIVCPKELNNRHLIDELVAGLPRDTQLITTEQTGVTRLVEAAARQYGLVPVKKVSLPLENVPKEQFIQFLKDRNQNMIDSGDIIVIFGDGNDRGCSELFWMSGTVGKTCFVVNDKAPVKESEFIVRMIGDLVGAKTVPVGGAA